MSHLPPTEQHMIKKINGEFINMTNKIDKKKNIQYKKNEKVYESENFNEEFSNKICNLSWNNIFVVTKAKESKIVENIKSSKYSVYFYNSKYSIDFFLVYLKMLY